ncbi:MAG: YceI family protein [Thermoanaerobaculia bacterium]|nr:YceI family protein [Thermoanaerobaculia bacterium]
MRRFTSLLSASALVLGFALSGAASAADTYTIDGAHSDVSFQVRHIVSQVRGQFDTFEGTVVMDAETPEKSSVNFVIDAASINTHNGDRDTHLRGEDFFEVETHPEITFESSSVRKVSEGKYQVVGTLTMHGVSKETTLPVEFFGAAKDPWGGTRAGFGVSTSLDRKAYGINWNAALDQGGFVLGDEIKIEINLETQLQVAEAKQADAKQADAKQADVE